MCEKGRIIYPSLGFTFLFEVLYAFVKPGYHEFGWYIGYETVNGLVKARGWAFALTPNNMFKWISIGIKNCVNCGSYGYRNSMLCGYCEAVLFETALNSTFFKNDVRRIPTRSLFLWQRDQNRILNRISLALKGTGQSNAWRYYADRFLDLWLKTETVEKEAVFVPCPAKQNHDDHAYFFAEALSKNTGVPLRRLLTNVNIQEQKHLGRAEREFGIRSKFNLCSITNEKFSHVYFVDDIITTGSTLYAAHSHLKKLGHVKGISLIIRE